MRRTYADVVRGHAQLQAAPRRRCPQLPLAAPLSESSNTTRRRRTYADVVRGHTQLQAAPRRRRQHRYPGPRPRPQLPLAALLQSDPELLRLILKKAGLQSALNMKEALFGSRLRQHFDDAFAGIEWGERDFAFCTGFGTGVVPSALQLKVCEALAAAGPARNCIRRLAVAFFAWDSGRIARDLTGVLPTRLEELCLVVVFGDLDDGRMRSEDAGHLAELLPLATNAPQARARAGEAPPGPDRRTVPTRRQGCRVRVVPVDGLYRGASKQVAPKVLNACRAALAGVVEVGRLPDELDPHPYT